MDNTLRICNFPAFYKSPYFAIIIIGKFQFICNSFNFPERMSFEPPFLLDTSIIAKL